jgi:hypothetical protein
VVIASQGKFDWMTMFARFDQYSVFQETVVGNDTANKVYHTRKKSNPWLMIDCLPSVLATWDQKGS